MFLKNVTAHKSNLQKTDAAQFETPSIPPPLVIYMALSVSIASSLNFKPSGL